MVMTLWFYGLELRLLHAHTCVCEISKFIHGTYFQSGDRSKNDYAYKICRFVHTSYY